MTERSEHLYDLPTIYDILHARDTAWEVDGLQNIAAAYARTGSRSPTWFEPACGSGRYLVVAARRGIRVIGTDINEEMVAYTSRRLLPYRRRATIAVGDMRSIDSALAPRGVDFAFNLINTIRHLPSDDEVLAHFESLAGVLRPGGAYVVGLSTTIYGAEHETEDTWEGGRGKLSVRQLIQYLPAPRSTRVERVISHITASRPSGDETIESAYDLRSYSLDEWLDLLQRSPFRLAAVVDEIGETVATPVLGYGLWVLTAR